MEERSVPAQPANDNVPPHTTLPDDGGFAFAIGEDIEVMTRGVIIERAQSATGRSYLVRAVKEDGREIYIRAPETHIFEPEPAQVAA